MLELGDLLVLRLDGVGEGFGLFADKPAAGAWPAPAAPGVAAALAKALSTRAAFGLVKTKKR